MKADFLFQPLKDQNGIALLITLAVITILLSVGFELYRRMGTFETLAESAILDQQLLSGAKSLCHAGKLLLIQDARENKIDTLQESWADPQVIQKLVGQVKGRDQSAQLTIEDEMGKIQVNALLDSFPGHQPNPEQIALWQSLLSLTIDNDKSKDDRDKDAIINCIMDWIDNGDDDAITGISGAESDYYARLNPPYICPNREISDINELFLVKGITQDLFSPKQTEDLTWQQSQLHQDNLNMAQILTVYGMEKKAEKGQKSYFYPGKININTAPLQVIAALLSRESRHLAQAICDYRVKRSEDGAYFLNDLSTKQWYAQIAGMTEEDSKKLASLTTDFSTIFSIHARVAIKGKPLAITEVVQRQKDKDGKWECKTIAAYF